MFKGIELSSWAYPVLEIMHILGIAMLLGNLVLLELRVFGRGKNLPVADLARLSLGLAAVGFSLAALSGVLMFGTRPAELLSNRAFTLKMVLLFTAACNAGWFHARQSLEKLDFTARALMVLSTVIWIAVVTCGRWIAYL
jgi:hypothetical protein